MITLLALGAGILLAPVPDRAADRLTWLLGHRFDRPTARDPTPVPFAYRLMRRLRELASPGRRRAEDQDELGRVVAAVIEECRAGASPAQAFAAAGRSGPYAASFAAAASTGGGEVVRFPPGRDAHLASLSLACRVNALTGMPLASALSGVAADLQADRRLRLAVDRSVSGPRSSATLLALLPALGVAMGEAMGVQPASLLVHSSTGRLLLCAGAGLDLAGVLWTRALVRRVRP